jgi:hypothetical protein
MYRFWNSLLKPLLTLAKPDVVVEIGCGAGDNTRNLISFTCSDRAILHAIDPAPTFAIEEYRELYESSFVFHAMRSLDALPNIPLADVVLIDGDHNWFTVYHELALLEKLCQSQQKPFPLTLVHDVGWPYGRRDVYYRPADIPSRFRHPFAKKGMSPDSYELCRSGGLNPTFNNAIREGGRRNGVLTAVEDFLTGTTSEIEYIQLDGYHGLGILASRSPTRGRPLNRFLSDLRTGVDAGLGTHTASLEAARIRAELAAIEQQRLSKGSVKAPAAQTSALTRMSVTVTSKTATEGDHLA